MNTKAITIRTETSTIDDIDALAKAMDRSRNYIVNQAMISYVARSISAAAATPAPTPKPAKPAKKAVAVSAPKKKGKKKKKKKAGKKSKK